MGSSRAYLKLEFGPIVVTTLLDTGAARSIIDKEVFLDICSRTGRPPLLSPTSPLHSVTGQSLELLGETEILENSLGKLRMVVAKRLRPFCIFGTDLLAEGRAVVDYRKEQVEYNDLVLPMMSAEELEVSGIGNEAQPQSFCWQNQRMCLLIKGTQWNCVIGLSSLFAQRDLL